MEEKLPKIKEVCLEDEAFWVNKDGLMKRFEGLNRNTLNKWLVEMRKHIDFRQYVVNPTHKLVRRFFTIFEVESA